MKKTSSDTMVIGAVIPTFRHVEALPGVIAAVRAQGLPVLIVDDGNAPSAVQAIRSLAASDDDVYVMHRTENGGKGAAMKDGFRAAAGMGWTHVLQLDADGQHDAAELPVMLELSRKNPRKVICAVPVYDDSIPKARKFGRELTHFWVRVETLSLEISDSMCGFRIYPLQDVVHVVNREMIGDRMDFDTEVLVHLNWRGLRVVEHPTGVIYPEGNVSNFRMFRDNVRITAMHTRLAVQALIRVPIRTIRRMLDKSL